MKAIVFDLDGTLVHFTREYGDVLADAFEAVRGETRAEWVETYDEAFYERFAACEPDPVRRAFARVDGGAAPDDLVAALREREVAMCQPPQDVHVDLERLAGEYRLGVLTNGVPAWQRHKLRAFDLEDYFDVVVASYEAGAHKPAVEPFRLVEERLPADAYAMVGDDDADVDGARNAGWTAYRYDGQGFGDLPDALSWE